MRCTFFSLQTPSLSISLSHSPTEFLVSPSCIPFKFFLTLKGITLTVRVYNEAWLIRCYTKVIFIDDYNNRPRNVHTRRERLEMYGTEWGKLLYTSSMYTITFIHPVRGVNHPLRYVGNFFFDDGVPKDSTLWYKNICCSMTFSLNTPYQSLWIEVSN